MEPNTPTYVEYIGGAKRTSAKPYYRLIDGVFLEALALALTEGEFKYPTEPDGIPNWQHGSHDFAEAAYDHAFEHLVRAREAAQDKDYGALKTHLGHCAANLQFLLWFGGNDVWFPPLPSPEETASQPESPAGAGVSSSTPGSGLFTRLFGGLKDRLKENEN